MDDHDTANTPQKPADPGKSILQRIFSSGPQGVMQSAGLVFTFAAMIAFVYGAVSLVYRTSSNADRKAADAFDVWRELILPNFGPMCLILIGIVSALLGIRLFAKASALTSSVVQAAEAPFLWPLITSANREAINEYIRLASLAGFTGNFTKIGFTGLPLVTVALTLILLVLTLVVDARNTDLQKGLFDLAKLTLGAFLGSFVQRNIEQEKLAGKASPPPPPPPPAPMPRPSPSPSASLAAPSAPTPVTPANRPVSAPDPQ